MDDDTTMVSDDELEEDGVELDADSEVEPKVKKVKVEGEEDDEEAEDLIDEEEDDEEEDDDDVDADDDFEDELDEEEEKDWTEDDGTIKDDALDNVKKPVEDDELEELEEVA